MYVPMHLRIERFRFFVHHRYQTKIERCWSAPHRSPLQHNIHMLRPFISDWLMFKIVECDWLMNLRGTGYPFDKINDNKRIKQNNDSKCLISITLNKTL